MGGETMVSAETNVAMFLASEKNLGARASAR
jgi:hypothetical protein